MDHYCSEHNIKFYKNEKGGKTWYSHKLADGSGFHNEPVTNSNPPPRPMATVPQTIPAPTPTPVDKPLVGGDEPKKKVMTTDENIHRSVALQEANKNTLTTVGKLAQAEVFYLWLRHGMTPEVITQATSVDHIIESPNKLGGTTK